MNTRRGDQLLALICAGRNGQAANELLSEFFDGYPLEKLRSLLHSSNEEVVTVGTFIASELGQRFAPLMDEVPRLLGHPNRSVRFDALDVVLDNATSDHGATIATAITLLCDTDDAVRWQTLRFLARATDEQLRAGSRYLEDSSLTTLTSWLVGLKSRQTAKAKADASARLESDDSLVRRFAAVAAARFAHDDPVPLGRAAASADAEVRQFAQDELELLDP